METSFKIDWRRLGDFGMVFTAKKIAGSVIFLAFLTMPYLPIPLKKY